MACWRRRSHEMAVGRKGRSKASTLSWRPKAISRRSGFDGLQFPFLRRRCRILSRFRGRRRRILAIENADVIHGILKRRERRTRGKHPPTENRLGFRIGTAVRRQLTDLKKCGTFLRFVGPMIEASAGRYDEGAKTHALAYRSSNRGDSSSRLIETLKHGDRLGISRCG